MPDLKPDQVVFTARHNNPLILAAIFFGGLGALFLFLSLGFLVSGNFSLAFWVTFLLGTSMFGLLFLMFRNNIPGTTTIVIDDGGITVSRFFRGKTSLPEQKIAWEEIYGILMRGRHKDVFVIEFHTNGPPPGRQLPLGANWPVDLIRAIRPYAKEAGFTIRPKFTKGFMSEEIWRIFKR